MGYVKTLYIDGLKRFEQHFSQNRWQQPFDTIDSEYLTKDNSHYLY